MSVGVSLNELAKFVLVEYVKQSAEAKEGTPALLRHLDTLVRTLQLQATALTLPALNEAPEPTKQPLMASKDTQQDRLDLHETVDAILKTVIKLCESEEAARNAKARMEAMRLANTTIRTDLALLQGYDRRDIQVLLDEVRETNEQFRTQLAESQRGTKEAAKQAGS
jgi:sucrose-6-phosphate hydrolase SacC (GH32 family)